MPKFHFYLVSKDAQKHLGSVDLPSQDDVISAGLKRTVEILANVVRRRPSEDGLVVQATNEAGAPVYTFEVSRSREGVRPFSYPH